MHRSEAGQIEGPMQVGQPIRDIGFVTLARARVGTNAIPLQCMGTSVFRHRYLHVATGHGYKK
jgi:hypothetical protein